MIGVTAVGNTKQIDGDDDPNDYLKSYYSAYGISTADVAAPGGDFYYGRGTDGGPFGLVLSTWPSATSGAAARSRTAGARYCYLQGTSMASPHAAGVAALIISRYGDFEDPAEREDAPRRGRGAHAADRRRTAVSDRASARREPRARHARTFRTPAIRRPSGDLQECQGGAGHNSWYGAGQINALRAVTK